VSFPFLASGLLRFDRGVPERLACGTLPPGLTGLYFVGLITPAGGNFPVLHAQARLVADFIAAQKRHARPLASTVFAQEQPTAKMYGAVAALVAEAESARRALATHGVTA
jgi:hypothetical protein